MKKSIRVVSDIGTTHHCFHYFYNVNRANLFMSINPNYGVLKVTGKRIYLAELTDLGIKLKTPKRL